MRTIRSLGSSCEEAEGLRLRSAGLEGGWVDPAGALLEAGEGWVDDDMESNCRWSGLKPETLSLGSHTRRLGARRQCTSLPAKDESRSKKNNRKRAPICLSRVMRSNDNDEDEDDDEEESGAEDGAAKPRKKRGNRGNFHGKRLALLQSWVPEAPAWLGKEHLGCCVSRVLEARALAGVISKTTPPDDPEELKRLDLPPVGDEERKQKQKIMKQTELSIQSWFSRQRVASSKPNPFKSWLKQLRTPAGNAPRRLTEHQFYMSHPDFKDKVNDRFVELGHHRVESRKKITLRCAVAVELLEKEDDAVKERIRQEVEAEHQATTEAFENAKVGGPSPLQEDQQEARRRLPTVVQPLLDCIAEYTGSHVFLVFGSVEKASEGLDCQVRSMQSNVSTNSPSYLDFSKLEPNAYAQSIHLFSRFVSSSYEAQKALEGWSSTVLFGAARGCCSESLHRAFSRAGASDGDTRSECRSGKRKRGEDDEGRRKRRKRKVGAREVQEEASSGDETTETRDGSQGGQGVDGDVTMEEGKGKSKKSKPPAVKAGPMKTAPGGVGDPAREDLELERRARLGR
ncbi:hypothetical protein C8F01DRAFT_1290241 [Mycena amicta]|nr:hypothetical protein C8F01DRAFT_1290241 [Mycena amicta]